MYVTGAILTREHRASCALAVAKLLSESRKELGGPSEDVDAFLSSNGSFDQARSLIEKVLGAQWLDASKSGAITIAQAASKSDERLSVCNAALERRKLSRRRRRSSRRLRLDSLRRSSAALHTLNRSSDFEAACAILIEPDFEASNQSAPSTFSISDRA